METMVTLQNAEVFYLNDRDRVAVVYIHDFTGQATILRPAQGKLFTYPVPPNCIPLVKVWETGVVLLSYMDRSQAGSL